MTSTPLRRLSVGAAVLLVLLTGLLGASRPASAQGCVELVPPLLFDTSDNPAATPSNPRSRGAEVLSWGGHQYLLHGLGNELELIQVDDPANPGWQTRSNFRVPPYGDRDYNLFNFSVCDGCRFGAAGFDSQGLVLWDFGQGAEPRFGASTRWVNSGTIGAFTFSWDDQQYLIARVAPECQGNALVTFDGVQADDLGLLQCITDVAGTPIAVDAGFWLPDRVAGDDVVGFVYLLESGIRDVHMYSVRLDGGHPRLTPEGNLIKAVWIIDHGMDLVADPPEPWPPLAVSAYTDGLSVWDLSDPMVPERILNRPLDFTVSAYSVEVAFPYLYVGTLHTVDTGSGHLYDLSNPFDIEEVDPDFWDADQPWNSFDYMSNKGGAFTPDGEWLFLARYSVLERISLGQCAFRPHAAFTWDPTAPLVGTPVTFSDGSTGPPTSWAWDFGDGTGSTDRNPTHVYGERGRYTVTLTVANESGSDSAEARVTVVEPPIGGPERAVTPPGVEVGANTGLATDLRGNRLVVWAQASARGKGDGGAPELLQGDGIYGRAFDPSDDPLGDSVQLAAGEPGSLSSPAVSFDATRDSAVVWVRDERAITARVFDPDLNPATPDLEVTGLGTVNTHTPDVASASAGDFAVVWRAYVSYPAFAGDVIAARFFAPDGTPKGYSREVGGWFASISAPSVASDATGRSLVVWRQETRYFPEEDGVYGRYLGPDGEPEGPEIQILGNATGMISDPSVAMDTLGNAVVAWARDLGTGTGSDIYAQRLNRVGQPMGRAFRINSELDGDQRAPSVAVTPVGDLAAAWETLDTGVFARFFTGGGLPLGNDLEVAVADSGLTPVEPEVSVAPDNAMTVAYAKVDAGGAGRGLYFRTYRVVKPPGSCIADSTTCCLNDNRFQVRVSWEDFDGRTGVGAARPLTDDTGTFWFFNDANIELVLKVLDGTAINGQYWVFFGALSNVEYTITVTDTTTGHSVTYLNPLGNFGSVGDTEALPGDSKAASTPFRREVLVPAGRSSLEDAELYSRLVDDPPRPDLAKRLNACTPHATQLCLNQNRFALSVSWRDFQGNTGAGRAVPLSADTGVFWFFEDTNVELVAKVLDGTWLNGHHWVFYGALSNVEYTLTVTDTLSGEVRTYLNPSGTFASVGDTEAFAEP